MAREDVKIVITAQDRTRAGFKSASSGLNKTKNSVSGLTKSIIGPLGLMVGFAALSRGFSSVIQQTADFEQQLGDISTLISGDSTQAIGQFRDGINELLKVTPKSAEELGAAAYQIVSAGISDTAEALEVLKQSSRLAVAGLGTTEEATNLLTSSLNAFKIDVKDADKAANILFTTVKAGKTTVAELARGFGQVAPIAAEMGIELDDLQAATAALTTTGMTASIAQTSLKAAMANLLKPTKEMQEAFEKLGVVSGKQLIQESENMVEVFKKIQGALSDNEGAFAKAFGSVEGLAAVLSLSGAQGETYKATLDEMRSGTDNLSEAVEKQRAQFNAQWQEVKNKFGIIMREVGMVILPLLIKAFNVLQGAIAEVEIQWNRWVDFLAKHIEVIDRWISRLATAISLMGKVASKIPGLENIKTTATSIIKRVAGLPEFDNGGVVGGPLGAPKLAMVHGGETILPTHKRGGTPQVVINNPVLLDDTMIEALSEKIGRALRNDLRI